MENLIYTLLREFSAFLKPYLPHIATALVATLLVVYGEDINSAIRRRIAGLNFFIRMIFFVLLCAFGYGLLVVALTKLFLAGFRAVPPLWLGVAVVALFVVVGILAEKKRQI
jgi:uncharacterized membrane protein